MKALAKFCLLAVLLFDISNIEAQEKIKFGEVPVEDLSMAVYPDDTTAVAVVLYENCDVRYDVSDNDFVIRTYHTIRIKVLKSAGLGRADISIPYYKGISRTQSEWVSGINGHTYNMVNGKTERTKLSKEHIFEEKTSENWHRMKIAFPNVKVGSVFELKYEKTSPHYSYIDDFTFQSSIPVNYSRYRITVPEYFSFNKRTSGYERIDYSEKPVNITFLFGANRLQCSGQEMIFVAEKLPALKDDSYVWNKNDYISRISFDLMRVDVTGVFHKNFSVTWQDIDKRLMESESFGRELRSSNLMKAELASALKSDMTAMDKVTAILNLVKTKVQWDEKDALYIDNVKKAVKEGKGSSAEMNAALISLLRDAGFEAYPVVMSLRSRGRIFSAFPTQKSLNYFITGVDIDGTPVYMDASHKYGTVNVIPADCMVQEARCVFKDKPGKWVDLHEIGRNGYVTNIVASFNEDGKMSGTVQKSMIGVPCMAYGRKVDKQKSVDDTKSEMETDLNVAISDLEQGKPQDVSATEKFTFIHNEINTDDEYIYLNALIFPYIKDNPFKAETRKLPIEYPYPYSHMITTTLAIPEGYMVEEIPQSERITLGDKQITYSFQTQKGENSVQVVQRIIIGQTLFPATEYQHIRDFWAHIASKNSAQIVLKRL